MIDVGYLDVFFQSPNVVAFSYAPPATDVCVVMCSVVDYNEK